MSEARFSKFYHNVVKSGKWAELSPKEKAVYPVLLTFADFKTRIAWPSIFTIARLSGINRRQVMEATKLLEKRGLIVKQWITIEDFHKKRRCYRIVDYKEKEERKGVDNRYHTGAEFQHPIYRDSIYRDIKKKEEKENIILTKDVFNKHHHNNRKSLKDISLETIREFRKSCASEKDFVAAIKKMGYPEEELCEIVI